MTGPTSQSHPARKEEEIKDPYGQRQRKGSLALRASYAQPSHHLASMVGPVENVFICRLSLVA